jgi:hypothetical protein
MRLNEFTNGEASTLSSSNDSGITPSPIVPRPQSLAPSSGSDEELDGGFVGRETRRRLVEWWEKEYCAGRMGLCVVGKGMAVNRMLIHANLNGQNRSTTLLTSFQNCFHRF